MRLAALALTALFLAACGGSNDSGLGTARGTTGGLYSMLREAIGMAPGQRDRTNVTSTGPALPQLEIYCPRTEVRAGTAHYIFYVENEDPKPRNVKFQGTLTETARECEFRPDSIKIKFGFAGRVINGPKGGAGSVTLPVRAILSYREGAVAWTKLYNIPVDISPNERSTFFLHVEEEFEYTVPAGHRATDYAIYIGFDGDATDQGQATSVGN